MMPELLGRPWPGKTASPWAPWGAADVSQTVGEFLQSVRLHAGEADVDRRRHAGF